jgi:hypothetical protein
VGGIVLSHIVKALVIIQVSIIICLCIGVSPLSAGAQDKKSAQSKAWQMYVDCKPDLTPAQSKEFESKSWDDRKIFLATHCKHVLPAELAEPEKEEPAAVVKEQGEHKIAVFQIVNEAGMVQRDVSTLDTIVERTVKEEAHGRYGIVAVEPAQEGEYCNDNCMLEKARAKGATYAIHGKLSSFGSGQILSLELVRTDGAEMVASTVTDAVALEKLPGETRAAAELLIARSPFEKPATKSATSGGVMTARAQMLNRSSRLEPPGYMAPRVAAHIFFWMGLSLGAAGTILVTSAGDGPVAFAGIALAIAGGTFCIVAIICAVRYGKKRRARWEWNMKHGKQIYGGPIVTPDFAGMGLVKNF